jgi:hypothetical protein
VSLASAAQQHPQFLGFRDLLDAPGHSAFICPFLPHLWHAMFAADDDGLPEPEILVTLLRFTSLFLLDSANFAAAFDSAFLCALRSARALSPASFRCCLIIAFAPVGSSSSSSSLSDSDSDELSPEDPESSCGFCSAKSANAPTPPVCSNVPIVSC